MARSRMIAAAILAMVSPAGAAESVMARCGRDYLAARTAGALDGATWTAFRIACADRVKAAAGTPAPAAASKPAAPPIVAAAATAPAAPPITSAAASAAPEATAEPGDGRAAMHARQKLCGAEWTAGKAALVWETPGLTWPAFWSRCNGRLKAAGR